MRVEEPYGARASEGSKAVALIACTECNAQVSDQAKACPQCVGLRHQNRGQELDIMRSTAAWSETADDLLQDSALTTMKDAIVDACLQFSKDCTDSAFEKLHAELSTLTLGAGGA